MRRDLGAVLVALALVAASASRAAAQAQALSSGSLLPTLEGESLSGKNVTLPAAGKVTLLVFTFSRKAGEAARAWADAFSRLGLSGPDSSSYRILVLGSVPRTFRGMVVGGIKKGIPAAQHDSTLQLFQDEELWKARLGVRSQDDPYLLILDRESKVRWLHSGACDVAGERSLAEQWKRLM